MSAKPREIAAYILEQRRAAGEYTETLFETTLDRVKLSSIDRALCQEIVYGVVRWQTTLDWLIARKTANRMQKPGLQDLLRLGLYQIFWLDRIPDHAAVNETVEMAKSRGFGAQSGFVNAVLRGYLREADETQKLLAELKTTEPAVGYSHPEWLVSRWQDRWGAERTARLLEWNNTPAKTFARANLLRADAGKLVERWRAEDVDYDFKTWDWTGENLVFLLKSHPPLPSLPSFREGWFYVQDPSTLLAVRELDPQPGDTVLDLCAAPGGKTTFIAQVMQNQGRVVAADISSERLKLIHDNCARLGVTCAEVILAFSLQPSAFEKVLVDAPCSNTGVIRRRVDSRWRLKPDEIGRLCRTQLDLLARAAVSVRPGGVLVYSTCSLEPEENGGVVKQFLSGHVDFKLERERELLPFADGVDGAYVAHLKRTG